MRRVVHLSDVHFGRIDHQTVEPIISTIHEIDPDLVVVSGDLTQRARNDQFREARAFLDRLPGPQLVVPGNHDVPLYDVVRRFVSPLGRYRRYITDDLSPCYIDEEIAVVGVNTARSLTFKGGRINEEQIEEIRRQLCPLPDELTKIVVTHHPFDLPRRFDEENLVGRADLAMQTLARCGIDILLAGHFHIGHTGDTRSRYAIPGFSALVVQAGTAISTRGRGEPNSFNVLHIEHPSVTVSRLHWNPTAMIFEQVRTERFENSGGEWGVKRGIVR